MLSQEMRHTVDKHRLGYVATVSDSGEPNLSPKGTFVVVNDRVLAFGDIRSPGTVANLRRRPAVEVNFVDPLARRGFRARGLGTVNDRSSEAYRLHRPLFDRWEALADRIEHIVLIELTEVKPLSSPVYDDGADEDDLRAKWADILLAD